MAGSCAEAAVSGPHNQCPGSAGGYLPKNKDVLELRRIEVERVKAERWDGKLPTAIYAGAPIPFFNPNGKSE